MVEPRGSTKPAILGGILSSRSATWMLVGRVALLELVENAVTMLAVILRQNRNGLSPPKNRTRRERLTTPWIASPASTTRTYASNVLRMVQPSSDVTTKMSPNTP